MNWIRFCFMIIMTTVTGTAVFGIWKLMAVFLNRRGCVREIRHLLIAVILFFVVPAAYVYAAWSAGVYAESTSRTLFWRTPFLVRAADAFLCVWLIGVCVNFFRIVRIKKRLQSVIRDSREAYGPEKQAVLRVRNRLQIRKQIPVYLAKTQSVPVIAGIWNCRIILPDQTYAGDELEMILEHEMRHYRQGDLFLKGICTWIRCVHWMNPLSRRLFSEVDRWGDALCDQQICRENGGRWSGKQYFEVVLGCVCRDKGEQGSVMKLGRSAEEIKERIERMKKGRSGELKKRVQAALGICFLAISSVTAAAAGKGTEIIYDAVYQATERTVEEAKQAQVVSKEYEWMPGDDITVIESGENLNMRGSSLFTWTIPEDTLRKSGTFYAAEGTQVTIAIVPEPVSARTGVGLDQPNGYLRGVSGAGAYVHTFTIYESGVYSVYARNESSGTITATVTVVR